MADVQIEAILKGAIAQAEHRVEACVAFLDDYMGAALADLVLESHRWSMCVAGDYALVRGLGAALRFPDLEIIVCLHVDQKNKHHVQRCVALADEMALTNVSLFVCGEAASTIDGGQIFDCPAKARLYLDPWMPCPVHMQPYTFSENDAEHPKGFMERLHLWAEQDTLVEIWDIHQYGDVALSLMVAAQYAAQGRQVWCVFEAQDLCDAEVLTVANEIGHAHLPIKCLLTHIPENDVSIPWSRWGRMHGWWIHAPVDAVEAQSWMQSSVDHMWPSLVCLPEQWHGDVDEMRFASSRRWGASDASVHIVTLPHMSDRCHQAVGALNKIDVKAGIQIISSLAPLSQLHVDGVDMIVIVDDSKEAPLSDLILPVLSPHGHIRNEVCGPSQCQGQIPQASDIAALIRSGVEA